MLMLTFNQRTAYSDYNEYCVSFIRLASVNLLTVEAVGQQVETCALRQSRSQLSFFIWSYL